MPAMMTCRFTSTLSAAAVLPLLLVVLLHPSSCAAAAATDAAAIVDLSQDFEEAPLDTPGAAQVEALAASVPELRTALVLEHGKIVASYLRNDDNENTNLPFQIWSATKSWISLLVGIMVQDDLVSIDETLGEVFTDEAVWNESIANETDRAFVQDVTIREMLTMSSGLLDLATFADPTTNIGQGGNAGGRSLADSLAWPTVGGTASKGTFSYLGTSNILSYVVEQRTGKSPREYANDAQVFAGLGIDNSDLGWWQNEDGMEYSFHGMELTATQMAKFGQLYLQQGLTAPASASADQDTAEQRAQQQLVSSDWVVNSTSLQVGGTVLNPITNETLSVSYGYLFWLYNGATDLGFANVGDFYCAIGFGGQDICVSTDLDRVCVQQRDYDDGTQGNLIIASLAFDETLSFESSSDGTEAGQTTTSGADSIGRRGRVGTNIVGSSMSIMILSLVAFVGSFL